MTHRNLYLANIIISLICYYTLTSAEIKILLTAAILPPEYFSNKPHLSANYETRKRQYTESLLLFKKYGLPVYMVESCQKGPTFLDNYCDNVCYTHSNIYEHAYGTGNYGMNEVISIKIGLEYFAFNPDDMIIKFTGRYQLKTTEFIDLVNKNIDADAVLRVWPEHNYAYSALFAMKMHRFTEFLNSIDYEAMKKGLGFEQALVRYIQKIANQGAKIVYLPKLYDYLPLCVLGVRS